MPDDLQLRLKILRSLAWVSKWHREKLAELELTIRENK
jgi:hypothetical protein